MIWSELWQVGACPTASQMVLHSLTLMISPIRYELLRGSWELRLGRCWRKYKDYTDNTTNPVSFISLVKSLRYLSSVTLQSFNQICNRHFEQQLERLLQIFGSDPSCANYLKVLIESLFSHTACLLTKIQVQSVAWFCILLLAIYANSEIWAIGFHFPSGYSRWLFFAGIKMYSLLSSTTFSISCVSIIGGLCHGRHHRAA